jgi:hypothetical protein
MQCVTISLVLMRHSGTHHQDIFVCHPSILRLQVLRAKAQRTERALQWPWLLLVDTCNAAGNDAKPCESIYVSEILIWKFHACFFAWKLWRASNVLSI